MSIAHRASAANRQRKWSLFLDQFRPTDDMRVLDVGYSNKEHSPVDNYIEKHYPYPERLVALGVEPVEEFASRYPLVTTVQYDGSVFPFADNEFDVCWSNAVLEHVGGFAKQVAFVREVRRVARRMFITTPNRDFPLEVHTLTPFLHYLPETSFHRYLKLVGKGWATGDYMHLLGQSDLRRVLDEAGVMDYRLVKNRLMGLTLDFVVITDSE